MSTSTAIFGRAFVGEEEMSKMSLKANFFSEMNLGLLLFLFQWQEFSASAINLENLVEIVFLSAIPIDFDFQISETRFMT